ncbi:hypothetical protein BC834DRAFT_479510 [Gloeopeniophorella convolvens]|nr:hypothetical protein BC834DRAFT_479510 [Gloeopeniophorella convolvens]
MSQAKLTLRPPPNVEFVQGYPGIPPGAPDRPQAAVKGAIEVRLGPQGVKAKYVRIELRKIETLPGGLQNSFYDFVGQSPINLWQSSEEYGMLHTQDIPFYIRIPESIPPTLALEGGAGVKYELVGQVCIQGKTGFFRRNKSIILSTSTPIIIDKHELHSTWPVYQQPESRHLTQDAVMLTVDRSQNCYGPGDRVSVQATIRSDSIHTVILRGFEFTLKETTIFRAGPHATGKKGAPQVKINIIGEQKVPVNMTLHGGQSHRSELFVTVPQTHTTTTLTSARHIDITYVLIVKALMGTGKPLIMELPVMVSNWPRYVSTEAIRRIGIAPSLSLQQPVVSITATTPASARPRTAPGPNAQSATIAGTNYPYPSPMHGNSVSGSRMANTMPGNIGASAPSDEMGFVARPSSEGDEPQAQSQIETSSTSPRRRSRAGSGVPQTNRFTVTNMGDNDIPEERSHTNSPASLSAQAQSQSQLQSPPQPQPPRQGTWLTAEEEKARLYQQAKERVDRVQGGLDRGPSLRSANGYAPSSPQLSTHSSPSPADTSRWATAEEEKIRLFNQAQQNARILQSYAQQDVNESRISHDRGNSRDSSRSFQQGSQGRPQVISAGAALYSQAMSAVNKPGWNVPAPTPHSTSVPISAAYPSQPPRLPTAVEEKDMLQRYHDAANAVQRHHEANFGSAEGIMPSASSSYPPESAASVPYPGDVDHAPAPAPDELPPPWVPSADFSQPQGISEKERYRLAFEAREAASRVAAQETAVPPPESTPTSPPADYYTATGTPRPNGNGADSGAHVDAGLPPPWHPTLPASQPAIPQHIRARSPPIPPSSPGSPARPLTAAEEKAMLKARFEAEEKQSAAAAPPHTSPSPQAQERAHPVPAPTVPLPVPSTVLAPQKQIPTPPPLMPRPPASYIKETAEEDARLQNELAQTNAGQAIDLGMDDDTFGLLRPTSPFTLGWDSVGRTNGYAPSAGPGAPPLPPKVPLEN